MRAAWGLALPVMALLAPSDQWQKLSGDGLTLLRSMQFGPRKLPAEWVSLARMPAPAEGFDAEFAYNAIRIPLYLARAGVTDAELFGRLQQGMTVCGVAGVSGLWCGAGLPVISI